MTIIELIAILYIFRLLSCHQDQHSIVQVRFHSSKGISPINKSKPQSYQHSTWKGNNDYQLELDVDGTLQNESNPFKTVFEFGTIGNSKLPDDNFENKMRNAKTIINYAEEEYESTHSNPKELNVNRVKYLGQTSGRNHETRTNNYSKTTIDDAWIEKERSSSKPEDLKIRETIHLHSKRNSSSFVSAVKERKVRSSEIKGNAILKNHEFKNPGHFLGKENNQKKHQIFKRKIIKRHRGAKRKSSKLYFGSSKTITETVEAESKSFSFTEQDSEEIFTEVTSENTSTAGSKETIDGNGNGEKENESQSQNEHLYNDEETGDSHLAEDEEPEFVVNYGSECDRLDQETCWFEREVGDTITLNVNISRFKNSNTFDIRWIRIYSMHDKKNGAVMKIEPERLPWNMVWGSGGYELRLNPVTNSDMDPNSIAARVFKVNQKNEKVFQKIKELDFRIDIPPVDFGKIYPGEELNLNLENFLTLPEAGNFLLDWSLEKSSGKPEPLPSNFKLSPSGRSVVIKEFKKDQRGVLSCVVYSLSGIAVAKRKFGLLKIAPRAEKRSLNMPTDQKRAAVDQYRRPRCLSRRGEYHTRNSERTSEYNKLISRWKRFRKWKRMGRTPFVGGCKNRRAHRRLHPRWIPSLFENQETTLDPRVMSVEKLIELSENSDGTLDDMIPHEVYYVEPVVTVVSDRFLRFAKPPNFLPNCTTDEECGTGALCIVPKGQKTSSGMSETFPKGYCYCRPEYFGDGFSCFRIPRGIHREKRIRRKVYQEPPISPNLFYSAKDPIENLLPNTGMKNDQTTIFPDFMDDSKSVAYEEEDSYLLSNCLDRKECSQHAICYQRVHGHPYCRCLPGYHGNGIFCWEMIDYVPVDESMAVVSST